MSLFENVIALFFQPDVIKLLASSFLILILYWFALEFFRNRHHRREKQP
ncbi:MAG: hypothetical protein JSV01_06895 [Desulfobacterales bacterium]|nr:MAG: hypothetical protein JSV01_06895 [Desulfobacterales bacterium]